MTIEKRNYTGDALVLDDPHTVAAGASLTLGPGVIVKSQFGQTHLVFGSLNVRGTGLEPVVLTSIKDDAFGGDTNGDGNATAPAPGNGQALALIDGGAGSTIEHLLMRFPGGGSSAAINCSDSAAQVRDVRVEHGSGNGFRFTAHDGDLFNLVAFDCADDGILLLGGAFDVVHATVAGCGAHGIDAHPNGSWSGSVRSSISQFNGGENLRGLSGGEVFHTNGSAVGSPGDGNIDDDPLFADFPGGDLRLTPGSPCQDAADLALALTVRADVDDASRVCDPDLTGVAVPDMGAYERATWSLAAAGEPRLGTTLSFDAAGPPGFVLYALGLANGTHSALPYGVVLIAAPGGFIAFFAAPTGNSFVLNLPPDPGLAGIDLGVQALVNPPGDLTVGNLTNAWFGTLFG